MEKKISVALLGIGVISLFLGVFYLRAWIRAPFLMPQLGEPLSFAAKELTALDLQNQDTDRDGLSDYDELYVYQTSPYLEDSDSDGLTDKEEIEAGADPNCPKGKDCSWRNEPAAETLGEPESILPFLGISQEEGLFQQGPDSPVNQGDITKGLFDNMSPEEIREFLRQAGIPEEMIKDIDDSTLQEIFKQTLEEAAKPR